MGNKQQLAILYKGVEAWNSWKIRTEEAYIDLRGANLKGTDLSGVDFGKTDLRGANLSRAKLKGATFNLSNLSKTNLSMTDLRKVDFSAADLSEANLRGSDLSSAKGVFANFVFANLVFANLSNAYFLGTNLDFADLSSAHLRGVTFSDSILKGANLRGNNLSGSNLSGSNLSKVNLNEADLSGANLSRTNLSDSNLSKADLSGAVLIETNLTGAILTDCIVYGISAWNVQLEHAIQKNLIITQKHEATITIDNLKVAQFIYLMLNNREIRDVIDTLTTKSVLILGRFTPQRKIVLDALRDTLRKYNYLPILFDFEKPSDRDFTETITTLAHLAKFIIADLTAQSSVPQELQAIIPNLLIPVQPLLLEGEKSYAMFADFRKYHWVLPIHFYKNQNDLIASFQKSVIEPAEKKAKEIKLIR